MGAIETRLIHAVPLNALLWFIRILRLVFSQFFDIRGKLKNVKEKPIRKTCFPHEMKRLTLHIYLPKFC